MNTRHTQVDSTLGQITIVASGHAVSGLYFEHHWHPPTEALLGTPVAVSDDPLLARAATELDEYLRGERTSFDVPISLRGNDFQSRVWDLLNAIPFGERTTYGELADQLGDRTLARAVGRAVGQNPVSVIVPCHRVVGRDGKLDGIRRRARAQAFFCSRWRSRGYRQPACSADHTRVRSITAVGPTTTAYSPSQPPPSFDSTPVARTPRRPRAAAR